MKFTKQQLKTLDKKRNIKILTFTIMTTLALTGCSFQFKTDKVDKPDIVTQFTQEVNAVTEDINWSDIKAGNETTTNTLSENITGVANNSQLGEFQKAALVRVVDGDTIVVEIDGAEAKVRLIGVNTPESVASEDYLARTGKENTKEGSDASEYTKNILKNVDTVYLQKDASDTDQYGRLLRYVWIEEPSSDITLSEIATKMLNGILVHEHIAEPTAYEPDTIHKDDFQNIYDAEYDAY